MGKVIMSGIVPLLTLPGGLPVGYTPLTYIESTGTQYIDTGFVSKTDSILVKINFEYTSVASGQSIFGEQQGSGAYGVIPYLSASGTASLYCASSRKIIEVSVVANTRNIWEIEATGGTATWQYNGSTSTAAYSGTPTQDYSYFLFANNSGGTVTQPCQAKLYSCQIYDNGTLVRDYVPCVNPDGEIGLYDKANKKFYGNAGTGVFIGSEVA